MVRAGIPVRALVELAKDRSFAGLWPHQIYTGYRAALTGSSRPGLGNGGYSAPPAPELVPAFEAILDRVASGLLPEVPPLGIADVSGSMFGVSIGGEQSTAKVGDAAVVLAAMMASRLGYAATFDNDVYLADRQPKERVLDFAEQLRRERGMGGTQVAGSVVSLIRKLQDEPGRARPRTLYFFSDMQFHPPELQSLPADKEPFLRELGAAFQPNVPPLLAAIRAWRSLIGPVDVVLWNLASYDAAPLPSKMESVMMLAGFDANSFRHVAAWQASGSPAIGGAGSSGRDQAAELEFIRSF
jgi:hypothetical protein